MFGLRAVESLRSHPSFRLHPHWYVGLALPARVFSMHDRWNVVSRNRSATVAGFHGLSRTERKKKRTRTPTDLALVWVNAGRACDPSILARKTQRITNAFGSAPISRLTRSDFCSSVPAFAQAKTSSAADQNLDVRCRSAEGSPSQNLCTSPPSCLPRALRPSGSLSSIK